MPRGRIEAGTVSAMRVAVAGVVDGEERIVLEHLTRIADDAAPDWPRGPSAHGEGYRIEIRGVPSMAVDLELGAIGRNTTLDAGFAVGGRMWRMRSRWCARRLAGFGGFWTRRR